MPYFTDLCEIHSTIALCAQASTLWIDTEVSEYKSKNPQLSLIQILDDANDMTGDRIYILDVLKQPSVVTTFVDEIMVNPAIEKVFHNAKYDVNFLGKSKVKNVTCTLEMARKIPYHILPVPNYELKTLATQLCKFRDIDKELQGSDWGKRPLTEDQIEYASLDCIYLAQVHLRLLELSVKTNTDPSQEDLTLLGERYTQIEQQWKMLNSEMEYLQEKIKKAMQAQDLSETSYFKLQKSDRATVKVSFSELAKLVETAGINFDFPVTLTQKLQKDLGENLQQLPVEVDKTTVWRLTPKTPESDNQNE
ncbi:MAG: ribonuclease D [Nostocaceae cyanobacterium]|nr:ribonuclease D [Nostocaceae cyanobacterium]